MEVNPSFKFSVSGSPEHGLELKRTGCRVAFNDLCSTISFLNHESKSIVQQTKQICSCPLDNPPRAFARTKDEIETRTWSASRSEPEPASRGLSNYRWSALNHRAKSRAPRSTLFALSFVVAVFQLLAKVTREQAGECIFQNKDIDLTIL